MCTSLTLAAQPPQALPDWLVPFPRVQTQPGTAAGATYTALAPPADVITHYQRQMRAANIDFKIQNDGIGVSIVASDARGSAVVRIREDGNRSNVNVSYTLDAGPAQATAPLPTALPAVVQPQRGSAPAKRVATTPFKRVPYTWVMQSSILPGTSPRRYAAYYFEVPTGASVERPLDLPLGGTLVDVFPNDCVFSMEDQAGHRLTFRDAKEAVGRRLDAGSWSVFPVKCGGIDVFVR